MSDFAEKGFKIFRPEPAVTDWVHHALPDARRALADPQLSHWYACEGTWFVGLDALNNDPEGRVGTSAALSGAAIDFIVAEYGACPALHRAQISGVFPGYPRPRAGESAAGFRYRQNRFAAHVDGVIGKGQPKRRFVEEPHAFILGLPLTQASAEAAPLVVWEGSHRIMRAAFRDAFAAHAGDPALLDVTDVYQSARARVFAECEPLAIVAPPGGAMLLHRLVVHGVGLWAPGAQATPDGRLIAYFRPPMPGGARSWANAE